MTLKNFTAADFIKNDGTMKRADSTRNRRNAPRVVDPVPTSKPIVAKDADPNDVPSGTVPEILTWVGEDKERAQRALEVENADEKPRKGLIKALSELIDAESEDDAAADESKDESEDENVSTEEK
jgi:hypothetical protein